MAKTFRCSIVTPTGSILDEPVTYASIPAWDGQMGLLPGASPVLVQLGAGSLRLDFPEGGSRWFLLDGGFAQFNDDSLSLLSEAAIPAETINLAEARAELAEANARVTQRDADQALVQRQQARAMTKIALAQAQGSRGGI
ncbi:MAG: F0F1 ATP synthase subunit epsilon [Phycisphaeraceae bacterium]|nr:F0F1 ATP synthase subunit epsilon [Phycisphaerales bacterium]QOJ18816.1 MAG: F0F1 ATP synthase subunit epsilon [Phycisphaeraceae bacterium]